MIRLGDRVRDTRNNKAGTVTKIIEAITSGLWYVITPDKTRITRDVQDVVVREAHIELELLPNDVLKNMLK